MAFAAGSGVETSTYFMPEIVEASAVGDRARSHCRFRNRGTDSLSGYGIARMSSSAKRQCDRTLGGRGRFARGGPAQAGDVDPHRQAGGGPRRAWPHCRFAPPLIRFIPDSLTYSVPLFLNRQCDRILRRRARSTHTAWSAERPGAWVGGGAARRVRMCYVLRI